MAVSQVIQEKIKSFAGRPELAVQTKIDEVAELVTPKPEELKRVWDEKTADMLAGKTDAEKVKVWDCFRLLNVILIEQAATMLVYSTGDARASNARATAYDMTGAVVTNTFGKPEISEMGISIGQLIKTSLDVFEAVTSVRPQVPPTVIAELQERAAWAAHAKNLRARMNLPNDGKE